MNEIKQIKKFAGDYILKTATDEMRINTKVIDKDSLRELNEVLANLNLQAH